MWHHLATCAGRTVRINGNLFAREMAAIYPSLGIEIFDRTPLSGAASHYPYSLAVKRDGFDDVGGGVGSGADLEHVVGGDTDDPVNGNWRRCGDCRQCRDCRRCSGQYW